MLMVVSTFTEADIEEKVVKYHELNSKAKEIETEKSPLNADIKQGMKELNLTTVKVGTIEAVMSTQERTSMDETLLLQVLESKGLDHAIETKKTPNAKAVEDLLFSGTLTQADLAHCVVVKPVVVLTVKDKKTKKSSAPKTKVAADTVIPPKTVPAMNEQASVIKWKDRETF